MPNVIDRSSAEALIREQVVPTIFQDAPKNSTVMQLGRKLPNMTSKQTRVPVLSMHSPFEVIHKTDLYMAYRTFSLFCQNVD